MYSGENEGRLVVWPVQLVVHVLENGMMVERSLVVVEELEIQPYQLVPHKASALYGGRSLLAAGDPFPFLESDRLLPFQFCTILKNNNKMIYVIIARQTIRSMIIFKSNFANNANSNKMGNTNLKFMITG